MKPLTRLVLGAAIVAAFVNMIRMKNAWDRPARRAGSGERPAPGAEMADTNAVHDGDPAAEQDRPQPQDWRGAQNVTE
jgi:hypothetical protein